MDFFKGLFNALAATIVVALIVIFLCSLVSCRTKYITVPEYHDRYITHTDTFRLHTRDSIYMHDSVHVMQYQRNDTVYISRDRIRYKYKGLTTDSVRVVRDTIKVHDSVSVPAEVKGKSYTGLILCSVVLLTVVGCIYIIYRATHT